MKKLTAIAATLVLTLALFTACTFGGESSSDGATTTAHTTKTEATTTTTMATTTTPNPVTEMTTK